MEKTAVRRQGRSGRWLRAAATLAALLAGEAAWAAVAWAEVNSLSDAQKAAGWRLLFDGHSTAGWHSYNRHEVLPAWQARDGVLALTRGGGGDLVTDAEYGDFELDWQWRISRKGNSGVMYHVREGESRRDPWLTGPEYQLLDNAHLPEGPDEQAGALFALYAPARDVTRPTGQWNSSRLRVQGGHVQHWLNGVLIVEYELWSEDFTRRVAASKFAAMPEFARASRGGIVLQDHGDAVDFRDIKLLDLTEPPAARDGAERIVFQADLAAYAVRLSDAGTPGAVPALLIERNGLRMARLPLVAGLDSADARERLSGIHYRIAGPAAPGTGWLYEIEATAASSLWSRRVFRWHLFADHVEFSQAAWGTDRLGRCYFFSNGRPGRWDAGQSPGAAWNAALMADRYWVASPNHAERYEFAIAEPQVLGFGADARSGSEEDFRPADMGSLFSPPPLMQAFHRQGEWVSVGIGAPPGMYRFPAFEYSGSRYAGAAWWVDYLGTQRPQDLPDGHFESPVAALHFAYSALDDLQRYSDWLRASGFATAPSAPDVAWHHWPIFCGWAEQTIEAVPRGLAPNAQATQGNYEAWIAELERRRLPLGTIVIDDKWQKGYGNFEIDTEKWPDLPGFVARQHARGRHVLLWVPVAHADGLPDSLCVHDAAGHCLAPDLARPAYEAYLRARIRELVQTVGIDGFKEDWVWAPNVAGLPVPPELAGMEAPRRFQQILYSEAHRWRPDALVETQTSNAAFRDSSDVLRLDDVWYAARRIVEGMRERARIAHISGWDLVDTDNASSTTLETWWTYMQAQPTIGIPALYFVHRTESTQETPSEASWAQLAAIWGGYVAAHGGDPARLSGRSMGQGDRGDGP